MNVQEYIDTGILEQYCLSILADDQMREVEALRSKYPEIGAGILAIEDTLAQHAAAYAQQPPAGLEDTIWATLENLNKELTVSTL